MRFPPKLRQPTTGCSRLCAPRSFVALIATAISLGCATPTAVLNFTAPNTVTAGAPFTVTINVTISGQRDTVINSPIHFVSSDPDAVLPSDYSFTAADAGSHTWINGFTLVTAGPQTISATIVDATGITGSVQIIVSP